VISRENFAHIFMKFRKGLSQPTVLLRLLVIFSARQHICGARYAITRPYLRRMRIWEANPFVRPSVITVEDTIKQFSTYSL